ncbi:ribonuclease HII [Methanobacterium alkalithermotolerans]|uniref:Ribonuclease HII n=1 Tax=Methanobacterium alkalithermotolerans TaxID=2731220 RepID=A0A8T8K7X4_9EURY|nr:ribonuclease HII [Methanobacterium alkalithermotolerans]QUH23060.1 ribonuclease HII [Methanobacterium alkalithermotolerans]RJS48065.1 MAG: ribonuclease HII [Methanobacterium sp.]
MKILGIDEAGRGPVIGPLVVCGVLVSEDQLELMEKMGIKDSKKVAPKKRNLLARKIKKIAECFVVKISARDIDNMRAKDINLNEIEKIAMMKIIKESQAQSVIIDSVDVNPSRLCSEISEVLGPEIDIKAEHGADDNYVVVAAASIVAKVERDMEIEKLSRQYRKLGNLGSGYPSDPRTKAFLKNFKYDNMPEFVRKSWATVKKMKDN